ncbi:MAG TPA: hypothetical protein PKA64_16905, partial [Myxococcota bacterium]|nr:hypothetical protein [Myxococcota bacterium]
DAEARRRRRDEGEAARAELFDALARFAAESGAVTATRDGAQLVWTAGGREVRFDPVGPGDGVKVAWREGWAREGRLTRQAELGDRWVLSTGAAGVEERVMLVEAGLVRLMVRGLGLPEPGDDAAPAREVAPTSDPSEASQASIEPPGATGRRL